MMSWFTLTPPSSPVTLPVTLPGGGSGSGCSTDRGKWSTAVGWRRQLVLPQPGEQGTVSIPFLLLLKRPLDVERRAAVSPMPALPRQGEAAALRFCLYGTGGGSFGDLVAVTWGVGVGDPAPGVFLWVRSPGESSRELPQMLPVERDAGGAPLAADPPAVLNLAPPARLGFGKLGWSPIPGIFHVHPNDSW